MSEDFNFSVKELQSNQRLIADFLSDDYNFLNKFSLTEKERQALLSRDVTALNDLGLTTDQALGALSGAHSNRCIPKD